MTISAKIILDSLAPNGMRLTTFELKYPRFIHSEFMTHRMLSRNASSSRAIPIEKMIEAVLNDPAMPVYWGANQKGMQASVELDDDDLEFGTGVGANFIVRSPSPRQMAKDVWLEARLKAIDYVKTLSQIGLHKQIANRLLEPWAHMTTIASATCWKNFFYLRTHKDAQPEFQALARTMRKVYDASSPVRLNVGDWHTPYILEEDVVEARAYILSQRDRPEDEQDLFVQDRLNRISAGRCARVSYLTQDGRRDHSDDLALYDRLMAGLKTGDPVHASPLEHVAQALHLPTQCGNFFGWLQLRKTIPGEAGPSETSTLEEAQK